MKKNASAKLRRGRRSALVSRTPGAIISRIGIRIVLWVYAAIVVLPMAWCIISSLKSTKEFYANVWALPKRLAFENYVNAWKSADIGINVINSIIIVGGSMLLTLILASMVSYVVVKYKFRGSGIIKMAFIMGTFVPLMLGTIPEFLTLQKLHLYDTRIGLILVYTAYSMPLSVMIMTSIYETIPSTYAEAAMIDGCGHFHTFFRIMFPLSRAGLVTISIFNFLWTWNDYLYAMTFISSPSKRTLPVGMVKLQSTAMYKTDWGALFAGLVIIMIPSIIIYAIFNKQLQSGMNAGGIKG